MDSSVFTQALTGLGHSLPSLIAAIVALSLVMTRAAHAAGRKQAVAGAALLIGATLLRLATTLAQTAYYNSDAFASSSTDQFFLLIGSLHFLLSVVEAVGVVLLAWAFCKSAPDRRGESSRPY